MVRATLPYMWQLLGLPCAGLGFLAVCSIIRRISQASEMVSYPNQHTNSLVNQRKMICEWAKGKKIKHFSWIAFWFRVRVFNHTGSQQGCELFTARSAAQVFCPVGSHSGQTGGENQLDCMNMNMIFEQIRQVFIKFCTEIWNLSVILWLDFSRWF